MKKIICMSLLLTLLVGCGNTKADSVFTDDELSILDAYGLADKAQNECENQKTVKLMLKNDFVKSNFKTYCQLKVDSVDGINELIAEGVSKRDIEKYMALSYFNKAKISRYLKYDADSVKKKVLAVNMNLDKTPYEDATVVSSVEKDALINPYNELASNYEPENLINVIEVCDNNTDYCYEDIKADKRVVNAFHDLAQAASTKGFDLKAVSGYMDKATQSRAYALAATTKGSNYADKYVGRVNFNENGTGLALDVMIDELKPEAIEESKYYDWFTKNLSKYGFILRYSEDKEQETLMGKRSYHIRYVGLDLAQKLSDKKMSLEYYYATK